MRQCLRNLTHSLFFQNSTIALDLNTVNNFVTPITMAVLYFVVVLRVCGQKKGKGKFKRTFIINLL